MTIDNDTFPKCQLEEKIFSWGEPYISISPIFDFNISNDLDDIEFCIELFIKNNFKNQLLGFYNALINFEEADRIENFDPTSPVENRDLILETIITFLDSEKRIPPWKKYKELLAELDYLYLFEEKFNRKILFVNRNSIF